MTDCSCNHFPASLGNVTFDPGVTVGIGTTSPGGALSFGAQVRTDLLYLYEGSATNRSDAALGVRNDGGPAAIFPFGNVGIATSSPAAPLDAPATARFAGSGSQSIWLSTADQMSGLWLRNDDSSSVISSNGPDMYFGYIGAAKNLRFMGGGTVTQMILTPAGNVGIGNNFSPAYPLDVNGTVRATGLQLGGDMVLNGAIRDAGGSHQARVDAGGCYYAD